MMRAADSVFTFAASERRLHALAQKVASELTRVVVQENCDDKLDNNCNKSVNEGCAPTGYTARFGSAVLNSKGQKYSARVLVGGSTNAPSPSATNS